MKCALGVVLYFEEALVIERGLCLKRLHRAQTFLHNLECAHPKRTVSLDLLWLRRMLYRLLWRIRRRRRLIRLIVICHSLTPIVMNL